MQWQFYFNIILQERRHTIYLQNPNQTMDFPDLSFLRNSWVNMIEWWWICIREKHLSNEEWSIYQNTKYRKWDSDINDDDSKQDRT